MLYKSLRTGVLLGDFPNLFESIAALSVPHYEHCRNESSTRLESELPPGRPGLLVVCESHLWSAVGGI
jgi:hypothetical protein